MRIGKTIITVRRAAGPTLFDEVLEVVTHPDSEIRAIIAKMARSESKTYLDNHKELLSTMQETAAAIVSHIPTAGDSGHEA